MARSERSHSRMTESAQTQSAASGPSRRSWAAARAWDVVDRRGRRAKASSLASSSAESRLDVAMRDHLLRHQYGA